MDKGCKKLAVFSLCGLTIVLVISQTWHMYRLPKPSAIYEMRRNERRESIWTAFQTLFGNDDERVVSRTDIFFKKPPIYIITPTWPRPVQIPELTRLGYVLKNVENVIWIVAEDAKEPTAQVKELLEDLNIPFKYLLTPMPWKYRKLPPRLWPKGVSNRNAAMRWIYKHAMEIKDDSGAFYFADDDNTYDIRLFEEIRYTQKVSMFPVGFISQLFVSTPILDLKGRFKGFYEGWTGNRTYILDMAGFAVGVRHFMQKAKSVYDRGNNTIMAFKKGYEEETFLQSMGVPMKDIEFMADKCTKIYVWHTKTVDPPFTNFKDIPASVDGQTNLGPLNKYWCLYLGNRPCGVRWKQRNKVE